MKKYYPLCLLFLLTLSCSTDFNENLETPSSNNNTINFNQPLVNIEGNMTNDIDSNELADQLKNEVLKAINDAMK